jgi:hypothetical protein
MSDKDKLEEMVSGDESPLASFRLVESSPTNPFVSEDASIDIGPAKPESTAATPPAEVEPTTVQPFSPLAGLDLDTAICLRWALRDIKAKRTKLAPVSPEDLRTLIEVGLVEMRDDVPVLTNEGHRALD